MAPNPSVVATPITVAKTAKTLTIVPNYHSFDCQISVSMLQISIQVHLYGIGNKQVTWQRLRKWPMHEYPNGRMYSASIHGKLLRFLVLLLQDLWRNGKGFRRTPEDQTNPHPAENSIANQLIREYSGFSSGLPSVICPIGLTIKNRQNNTMPVTKSK